MPRTGLYLCNSLIGSPALNSNNLENNGAGPIARLHGILATRFSEGLTAECPKQLPEEAPSTESGPSTFHIPELG
jgi:hypothetical protein